VKKHQKNEEERRTRREIKRKALVLGDD
jgi:hypothetical protein